MNESPFATVLVANRGEIARRVIRTLHRRGIRSVAVYSDADADAPHVREADEAVGIGPAPAIASYLDGDAIIRAARRTGAEAIHPGYGFLSENAGFARACHAAGIVFIGPGDRALEVMGDKIRAKAHVAAHGVPVLPGFKVGASTEGEIFRQAQEIGYPLLVKPSAGGGGKGMQVVHEQDGLLDAIASARRIARASFADDALLIERLVEAPRHIEVQIMADAHGGVIHLGERECTLQRRHQKVIEEAPSPAIDDETRARIGESACAAARSVDYRGAGTVEFLVAADRPDEYFFIEMNTRLQVEHPVTEMITGRDLVAMQLDVAAGGRLPIAQADVRLDGHAVEARVYAESPTRGFLPETGEIAMWRAAPGVRTDAAVETGATVTEHYDPLIAKVISHASTREDAWDALDRALAETIVLGVDTNISFLRALARDADVRAGRLDTGLIGRRQIPRATRPDADDLARWAAAELGRHPAPATGSPWGRRDGWRLSGADGARIPFLVEDDIEEAAADDAAAADAIVARAGDGTWWAHRRGETVSARPLTRNEVARRRRAASGGSTGVDALDAVAPMPGSVVAVHVTDDEQVAAGAVLVTIEAMKMEHPVLAPRAGRARLRVAMGDHVRRGDVVVDVAGPTDA